MSVPTVYGMEVSLRCMDCKKKVSFEGPFDNSRRGSPDVTLSDCVLEAHTNHKARDECHPKEPE